MTKSIQINGTEVSVVVNHEKFGETPLHTWGAVTVGQVRVGNLTISDSYANGETKEQVLSLLEQVLNEAVTTGKTYTGKFCYARVI